MGIKGRGGKGGWWRNDDKEGRKEGGRARYYCIDRYQPSSLCMWTAFGVIISAEYRQPLGTDDGVLLR